MSTVARRQEELRPQQRPKRSNRPVQGRPFTASRIRLAARFLRSRGATPVNASRSTVAPLASLMAMPLLPLIAPQRRGGRNGLPVRVAHLSAPRRSMVEGARSRPRVRRSVLAHAIDPVVKRAKRSGTRRPWRGLPLSPTDRASAGGPCCRRRTSLARGRAPRARGRPGRRTPPARRAAWPGPWLARYRPCSRP